MQHFLSPNEHTAGTLLYVDGSQGASILFVDMSQDLGLFSVIIKGPELSAGGKLDRRRTSEWSKAWRWGPDQSPKQFRLTESKGSAWRKLDLLIRVTLRTLTQIQGGTCQQIRRYKVASVTLRLLYFFMESFGQRVFNGGNPGDYCKRFENTLRFYAKFCECIHILSRGFMAVIENLKVICALSSLRKLL